MSREMRKIINKKAQEEMVGFVAVVVLVAVIFLVFLGIAIRQGAPATQKESRDVSQFLQSSMELTTECAIYEPAYLNLAALIKGCYSGEICTTGENSCDMLKRTMKDVIELNWKIGEESVFKGYMLNVTYSSETSSSEILYITEGNCSLNIIGAEQSISAQPGRITTSLNLCS
jgi:hypothetical protein